MDLHTAQLLTSPEGERALTLATGLSDPDSLGAGERMRREFAPELAAAALSQMGLRRRARAKLGPRADLLLWTSDGVEQATRASVSAWRARRLVSAGITTVLDIGCGAGADALAFLDAGLSVTGVEIDPATALLARHNLSAARAVPAAGAGAHNPLGPATADGPGPAGPQAVVIAGDGVELAPGLIQGATRRVCVYLDPARRTSRGRSWRVDDLSPGWPFVEAQLRADHATCVKLGPGFPRELLPDDVAAIWVSDHGDLVECGLWHLPGDGAPDVPDPDAPGGTGRIAVPGSRSAVLLPSGVQAWADPGAPAFEVRAPGRYLYEPDPAVSRAGASRALAIQPAATGSSGTRQPGGAPVHIWRLAPGVGYLSGDEPIATPLATTFEVLEVIDHHLPALRAWVKAHRIGTLEIKKRAVEIDPAALRKKLHPKGPNAATLLLTPTTNGLAALVVQRLRDSRAKP